MTGHWVREGECCRCGDCCIGSPYPERPAVEGMCPNLTAQPDGARVCGVHDGDDWYWNNACQHWPSKPQNIAHLPRCTFTFRWVEHSPQSANSSEV